MCPENLQPFGVLVDASANWAIPASAKYDYLNFIFRFDCGDCLHTLCSEVVEVIRAYILKYLAVWIIFHNKEIVVVLDRYTYGLMMVIS